MEKTTSFLLLVTLLFMQWHSIAVESADTDEAKVTSAMQKIDNPYIAVVEDKDAKSGWAVDVKKAITTEQTENYFVEFFTRTDSKAKFDLSFAIALYDMLYFREKNGHYLPVEITAMIFPTQKANDTWQVQKTPILATAQVDYLATNFEGNQGFFPKTTPYELEFQLLTYKQLASNNGEYIFKVDFNIGGDINKK